MLKSKKNSHSISIPGLITNYSGSLVILAYDFNDSTGCFAGVVVYREENTVAQLGFHSSEWSRKEFKPYNGKITLEG